MGLPPEKRREYFNVPNYLTLGRILLIPIVMVLLTKISPEKSDSYNYMIGWIASGIFILGGLSDLVDGYLARKFNIDSIFGKYFDPLADKLMVLAVMVMLIPLHRIPAWMVVIFIAREIGITALRGIASAEGLEMPADQWGKKKTVLQTIALVALMVHYNWIGINGQKFGWVVLLMALAVSIFSGFNYIYRFYRAILLQYSGEAK